MQETTNDVDLTPMLDVVLIMLIFFIVSASFINETGLEIAGSGDPSKTTSDAQDILVTIDQDSLVWIDRRMIDPRAVRANIERLHAENPEASVVVLADNQSSNKTLVQVIDASRQAGIRDVALAASEK